MKITKHCKTCNKETDHYVQGNTHKCSVCMKAARKAAPQKKREAAFDKRMKDIARGIVQPRQYNLMTAPEYKGEKWINARQVMTETKPYIGASHTVQPAY